jgi:tripartite-type tricarboxylate transporter receptor subunit TctC
MKYRQFVSAALIGMFSACPFALAQSDAVQGYPNQVVKMITSFAAGSVTDALARVMANSLQDMWKQPVIVENRPGIPGIIGVARSKADGYTMLVTSNGLTIADVINKNSGFNPIKDFAGVIKVAYVPLVLVAPATLPANNLQELIALAKQSPGKLNYGSVGPASTAFLAAEIFKQASQTNFTHVPYKAVPDAITGVIRGDIDIYFLGLNLAIELVKAGKIKAIAVARSERSPALPDVPTFAQAGLPEYQYEAWFGIVAPALTPQPLLEKVSKDVDAVLKAPDVQARLQAQGFEISTNTPAQFDALMRSDADRYGKLLKELGLSEN